MDWLKRNFDPRGRTSRNGYWRFQLWSVLVLVPAWILIISATRANAQFIAAILTLISFIGYVVTQGLTYVRRAHDRNRPAIWVAVFFVLPFALSCADYFVSEQGQANQVIVLFASLIASVLGFWGFIELGFLRGTRGPNRFGPEPVR